MYTPSSDYIARRDFLRDNVQFKKRLDAGWVFQHSKPLFDGLKMRLSHMVLLF